MMNIKSVIKLICLNLALIMLFCGAFCVFATDEKVVIIDGEEINAEKNASGNGWIYHGRENTLELCGYHGARIYSSIPLSITSFGDVTVSGVEGTYYGKPALEVLGNLDIRILGGSIKLFGGHGKYENAEAVIADSLCVIGNGSFGAYGGDGENGAYALGIGGIASFDCESAELCAGRGGDADAVNPECILAFDDYSSLTREKSRIYAEKTRYKLTLISDPDGDKKEISGKYPNAYELSYDEFSKNGCVLVGWKDEDGNEYPLMTKAAFCADSTLYAMWEKAENGKVILISNEGNFIDESVCKTSLSVISLPDKLVRSEEEIGIFAWSDSPQKAYDDGFAFSGEFLEPSKIVTKSDDGATVLYAHARNGDDRYVYYYPQYSSPARVQTVIATGDLTVYALDGEDAGNDKFVGWSESVLLTPIDYKAGDPIASDTDMRLYAVYEERYEVSSDLYIACDRKNGKLRAVCTEECFGKGTDKLLTAVYRGGKLLSFDELSESNLQTCFDCTFNEDLTVKIFSVDALYRPTSDVVSLTVLKTQKPPKDPSEEGWTDIYKP